MSKTPVYIKISSLPSQIFGGEMIRYGKMLEITVREKNADLKIAYADGILKVRNASEMSYEMEFAAGAKSLCTVSTPLGETSLLYRTLDVDFNETALRLVWTVRYFIYGRDEQDNVTIAVAFHKEEL